jgi:hypothetical protein
LIGVLFELASNQQPDIKDLVASSLDTTVPEPFGTYLFVSSDPGAEIARDLERRVFLEAFGNTPALLANEYDVYEPASVFLCVIDHRRKVCAGMMRIIIPIKNGPGLKSLVDVEPVWGQSPAKLFEDSGLSYAPDSSWDIATLAVDQEYRTAASLGLMHIGLYQALARLAKAFEVQWLVAILDYAVYRLIRLQLRRSFIAFAGERPYLGSERSVPACCNPPQTERDFKEADPILYDQIYVGTAMKAALRQIDLDSAISTIQGVFASAE